MIVKVVCNAVDLLHFSAGIIQDLRVQFPGSGAGPDQVWVEVDLDRYAIKEMNGQCFVSKRKK